MRVSARIILLVSALVVANSVGLISIGSSSLSSVLSQQTEEFVTIRSAAQANRLKSSLTELYHDVQFLASLPVTRSIVEQADASISDRLAELESVLKECVSSKPYYAQVRVIGVADGGREIARVERVAGEIRTVSGDKLQRKGSRDYFQAAMATPQNSLYVSPITLNRERGEIEPDRRPMLRAAVRLDDRRGQPFGIVIINLDFQPFFDSIVGLDEGPYRVYLANDRGDYLMHPDSDKEFAFEFGTSSRLQDDHASLAAFIADANQRSVCVRFASAEDPTTLSLHKVSLHQKAEGPDLILAVGYRGVAVIDAVRQTTLRAASLTAGLIVFGVILAVGLASLITKPIAQLTDATMAVSTGQAYHLPVERRDEIGDLARAFQRMDAKLRENRTQLQQTAERLSHSNEELGHFVSIAAHDLREPLRKQRNYIELVQDELREGDPTHAYKWLTRIDSCSTQMQQMIDDFRALSRNDEAYFAREPVSIREIVDECVELFRDDIVRRRVQVHFDAFPDAVSIFPSLTKQLYQNLTKNAFDHTETVDFQLSFLARHEHGRWVFGVKNTGSSIPPEHLSEVFQMFRKVRERCGGSGIGLSICRKIVQRHGGDIWVESGSDYVEILFTLTDTSSPLQIEEEAHGVEAENCYC